MSGRSQKSVFHCDSEKRREDGAALADTNREGNARKTMLDGGPRTSYQHMAVEMKKKAMAHGETWSRLRISLFYVLDSVFYSVVIGVVIILNILLVIHEVDSLASGPGVPGWIIYAARVFLGIYIVEITARFYVWRLMFFRNAWNVLDFAVVITDICAEFANMFGLEGLPSISVLRIFRLVRLVRLIAMLSVFPELQSMLLGFASAMKAMVWASLMIGVVVTVCSILAVIFIHPLNLKVAETGVYEACERCGRSFETVAESNLTFMQQIIAGDSWGKVTIPIIEAYPLAGIFFLLVFAVIDLGVINLVLMVIVNAAETAREANQDIQLRKKIYAIEDTKYRLKNLCRDLDTNEDGRISLDEFLDGLDHNEDLRKALAGLDVQRQDAEIIFYLMDEDRSGDVDFHEFVGTLVSTNHESLATKLLFLKASIHQIYKDLTTHGDILQEDVVPNVAPQQVADIVKTIHDDASQKIRLQWNEIMSEAQSLAQKQDRRWKELQVQQAKSCHTFEQVVVELEKVVGDMLLPPLSGGESGAQSYARGSTLHNLISLPAAEPKKPKLCGYLCSPNETGAALTSRNNHSQRVPFVAERSLSGSIHHSTGKTNCNNGDHNLDSKQSWDIIDPKRCKPTERQP